MKKFLSVLFSALILFSFTSCQKQKIKKIDKAFENMLTTEITVETQTPPKEGIQIAELIFSKMTYTVTAVSENECVVTVVAPDISEIFWNNFDTENYSDLQKEDYQKAEEELMSKIKIALENNEYNLKTTHLTVPLENGEPEITYELADAFYGGLYSLTAELSDHYSKGGAD